MTEIFSTKHWKSSQILLGLLLAATLGMVGCSSAEEGSEEVDREVDSGTSEETYSELFTDAMIGLSVEMIAITSGVTTVAQADSVKGAVGASMDRLHKKLDYIVKNLDRLIKADPEGFREPADLMETPELKPVVTSAVEAMRALNEMNPTAAIRLQYHSDELSEGVVALLDSLNFRYQESVGGMEE